MSDKSGLMVLARCWPLWLAALVFCLSAIAAFTGSSSFGFEEPWFAVVNSGSIAVAVGFYFRASFSTGTLLEFA